MYKKVRYTCKVVVLPTKLIVVFDVLVAVASWDSKTVTYIPITSLYEGHNLLMLGVHRQHHIKELHEVENAM